MTYSSFEELAKSLGKGVSNSSRLVVCVQGLGFVGAAMAVAVADALDKNNNPIFNVIGVDLPTSEGESKVMALNQGRLPFETCDEKLLDALSAANKRGNFVCTTDPEVFSLAAVTVIDVPFDWEGDVNRPRSVTGPFRSAVRTLGRTMSAGSLVIVETTVPPGACEKVVVPELKLELDKRKLDPSAIKVAHSFERVMPGKYYLDSIINFWRVYSGHTTEAADACGEFLSKVINTNEYPLFRLSSTMASETAKVLENSYRAVNIAFMEEWGRFAEKANIDLFEVISAIRQRPTHSNIMQPGFGVGGYCLTKDPLFAKVSAYEYFEDDTMNFPFCTQAVTINNKMPLVSLDKAFSFLGGNGKGKKILLLGVSYRQDIGDTRFSPSESFVVNAMKRGVEIICHDPLLNFWPELDLQIKTSLPSVEEIDLVVFAVPHEEYLRLNVAKWLNGSKPAVIDANNVLSSAQRDAFRKTGCRLFSIGRGEEL